MTNKEYLKMLAEADENTIKRLICMSESNVENDTSSNLQCWEMDRTTVTQLVVPEGVTKIGSHAFWGCQKLKSLIIKGNVKSIGDGAFDDCSCLTSLNIEEGVESIGRGAFSFCTALKSLVIPEGLTNIGFSAFYNCKKLTSLIIPKSVTSIGHDAFCYCPKKCDIQIAKTKMQVLTMDFYPWGINNGAVVHCIDGDLIVGELTVQNRFN